ncbi:MAG: hypothetical protein FWH27_02290 [Planctomycetaceae bacterium]|nr:hypothetical protein [Planctomycetaceae bacterium]
MKQFFLPWIVLLFPLSGVLWAAEMVNDPTNSVDEPAEDFPRYEIDGFEAEGNAIRHLHWRHYQRPDSISPQISRQGTNIPGPLCVLWDDWIQSPAIWPATTQQPEVLDAWRLGFLRRPIASDGYIATDFSLLQSYAHPYSWVFPVWFHGIGGMGWHFSYADDTLYEGNPNFGFRPAGPVSNDDWSSFGVVSTEITSDGWMLALTEPGAYVQSPAVGIMSEQAPWVQVRFRHLKGNIKPRFQWTTREHPDFDDIKSLPIPLPELEEPVAITVPVYRHPYWSGTVTGIRIDWGNADPGAVVAFRGLCTHYDTRHNTNNAFFVRGALRHFAWTGDKAFLSEIMGKVRRALRHDLREFQVSSEHYVLTTWPGHDGRAGLVLTPEGHWTKRIGSGIGNNYWDIFPFGHHDAYATIQLYPALLMLADAERRFGNTIPGVGEETPFDPQYLEELAAKMKTKFNDLFWVPETGRFAGWIDADGIVRDFGFTSLNLEAIHYGLASDEHARSVLDWLSGDRLVDGDINQGADIYHSRFAPRCTTKFNPDCWFWMYGPAPVEGRDNRLQEGGLVLGFSYFDVMARLKVHGADDAWKRMRDISEWYRDVLKAGGYEAYYAGTGVTLQGNNVGGGLGLAHEFFESIMVPTVLLDGFLGFVPDAEGFAVLPQFPSDWSKLRITRIAWREMVLDITVTPDRITINSEGARMPCKVCVPRGWKRTEVPATSQANGIDTFTVDFSQTLRAVFEK